MARRIILLVIAFLFIYFILRNLNNGKLIFDTLISAKWEFVLLAMFLQTIHYIILSFTYKKSFELFDIKWKLKDLIPLNLAALSINAFTLLAPVPGSSLFLHKGRKENIPALNITASIFLAILFDYLALIPLIALSLLLLAASNQVFNYEILGATVFILLTIALGTLLVFGIISPKILTWLFKLLETLVNKVSVLFKKRSYLIKGWSESRALKFIGLSQRLVKERSAQLEILLISVFSHAIDIATLYCLFLAFGMFVPIPSLLIGYSLMILFWIITPTPQGVGVVETLIPAIFSSMNINIEGATLAVLSYRFLNLWIPVIVGYYFLNKVLED